METLSTLLQKSSVFEPIVQVSSETKMIECILDNCSILEKNINDHLTIFLSNYDKSCVGFRLQF